jgi:hypothetical protein
LQVLIFAGVLTLWCSLFACLLRLFYFLAPVVAAQEPGFALARAWTLSKGNFWRIFTIAMSAIIPFLLLAGLTGAMLMRELPSPPHAATPEQMAMFNIVERERIKEILSSIYRYWYLSEPAGIAVATFFYGLMIGAQSFAWRTLNDAEASSGAQALDQQTMPG